MFERQNWPINLNLQPFSDDKGGMNAVVKNVRYFQYFKDAEYPVFIKLDSDFLGSGFFKLLKEMHFTELSNDEVKARQHLFNSRFSRILHVTESTPKTSQLIRNNSTDDRFGPESFTDLVTHRVYRYKNQALIVYSFRFKEWQMGCHPSFAEPDFFLEAKIVMGRFLGWSLSVLGIVGFWGVPVEEGVVINKPIECKGEVVFFDVKRMVMLTIDGERKIKSAFTIIRLDSTLANRNIRMTKEELVGFLSSSTVYVDYQGLTISVRQVIQEIAHIAYGIIHPAVNFRPRMNLSN